MEGEWSGIHDQGLSSVADFFPGIALFSMQEVIQYLGPGLTDVDIGVDSMGADLPFG